MPSFPLLAHLSKKSATVPEYATGLKDAWMQYTRQRIFSCPLPTVILVLSSHSTYDSATQSYVECTACRTPDVRILPNNVLAVRSRTHTKTTIGGLSQAQGQTYHRNTLDKQGSPQCRIRLATHVSRTSRSCAEDCVATSGHVLDTAM